MCHRATKGNNSKSVDCKIVDFKFKYTSNHTDYITFINVLVVCVIFVFAVD